MKFEDTQIYKLGEIYKEIGETLMDPKTDIKDLVTLGRKYGFDVTVVIVPNDDSPINGSDLSA